MKNYLNSLYHVNNFCLQVAIQTGTSCALLPVERLKESKYQIGFYDEAPFGGHI